MAHNAGAALLDYTDPTQPAVLADGYYILSANVVLSGQTAGYGEMLVYLDYNGVSPSMTADFPMGLAAFGFPTSGVATISYFIPTGGVIIVNAGNFSGVGDVGATLSSATLLKL